MSLFDWLLVGHLVGDFLVQTDGMAKYKAQDWSWMLKHVGAYMAAMVIALSLYALSHPTPLWALVLALFILGGTHAVLDRRGFTLAWMRLVGITRDLGWLTIVIDQVFHLLILVLVAEGLSWASSWGGLVS